MTAFYYPENIDQELHEQLLHERKWINGQERMFINKVYRLVYDPRECWGFDTHLSRREITELIRAESIEPGCKFENIENGKFFEIVHVKKGRVNGLVLTPVM